MSETPNENGHTNTVKITPEMIEKVDLSMAIVQEDAIANLNRWTVYTEPYIKSLLKQYTNQLLAMEILWEATKVHGEYPKDSGFARLMDAEVAVERAIHDIERAKHETAVAAQDKETAETNQRLSKALFAVAAGALLFQIIDVIYKLVSDKC